MRSSKLFQVTRSFSRHVVTSRGTLSLHDGIVRPLTHVAECAVSTRKTGAGAPQAAATAATPSNAKVGDRMSSMLAYSQPLIRRSGDCRYVRAMKG